MSVSPRAILRAIRYGVSCRCPKCGKGRLFRAYLKPVDTCSECAEPLGSIRADDGPAWLTILIVGHVVVGVALLVEVELQPALWVSISFFLILAAGLTFALLPRAKGVFIGMLWVTKAPHSGSPMSDRFGR